jgi:transcriptional regulator with XRE-family HTH domain
MSTISHEPHLEPALRWLRSTIATLDPMPQRKRNPNKETFGIRLARLRKTRGLTQAQLGEKVGISYRMVAYYEGQTAHPPTHILPALAKALGVSADDLLGAAKLPSVPIDIDVRIWRRLQKIQSLPPGTRKSILRVLDSLLAPYDDDVAA